MSDVATLLIQNVVYDIAGLRRSYFYYFLYAKVIFHNVKCIIVPSRGVNNHCMFQLL